MWFLRKSGDYTVLPLASGNFLAENAFLPLDSSELPDPAPLFPV